VRIRERLKTQNETSTCGVKEGVYVFCDADRIGCLARAKVVSGINVNVL
jgi:hypothetical protein